MLCQHATRWRDMRYDGCCALRAPLVVAPRGTLCCLMPRARCRAMSRAVAQPRATRVHGKLYARLMLRVDGHTYACARHCHEPCARRKMRARAVLRAAADIRASSSRKRATQARYAARRAIYERRDMRVARVLRAPRRQRAMAGALRARNSATPGRSTVRPITARCVMPPCAKIARVARAGARARAHARRSARAIQRQCLFAARYAHARHAARARRAQRRAPPYRRAARRAADIAMEEI